MPNNQLLRNAFPKWFEGKGIFASMTSTPWQDEIDGITLDIEYFGNRSGYKFCAPLVYNFLDEDGAVTENGRQAIARVLLARYSKPWTRLWQLMKSQYDPLDNFSITEEIDMTSHASGQDKSNGTDTDKGTIETDHSGTDTNKSTGTEKTSRTGQNTSKDTSTATGSGSASRSGYNSTSPVTVNGQSAANSSTVNHVEIPNEDNTRTPDLTDERTLALKDKDTRDITIERNNLVERDNTQTDKGTRKRTGVSGLISRQRLVEQEREAWQWDFFESVFSDVDKILALSVYDPCVMSQFDYTGGGTSGGYVLPIATQSALGGVRAPAKTDGSVQVQVDAAGFLYVPPYPKIPEPSGGGDIEFASHDKLGGIKLPSEPSGDGEEISTKNGVQFVVDKTLSPEGGYKDDDTVSVVIPYAGERAGLVKGGSKTNETYKVAVDNDGTMWYSKSADPIIYAYPGQIFKNGIIPTGNSNLYGCEFDSTIFMLLNEFIKLSADGSTFIFDAYYATNNMRCTMTFNKYSEGTTGDMSAGTCEIQFGAVDASKSGSLGLTTGCCKYTGVFMHSDGDLRLYLNPSTGMGYSTNIANIGTLAFDGNTMRVYGPCTGVSKIPKNGIYFSYREYQLNTQ